MTIINKVSAVIGGKRLTIKEVAIAAGVSWDAVGRLYHDKSARVDFTTLNALCRVLDCQPGDLFEYVPDDGENNNG